MDNFDNIDLNSDEFLYVTQLDTLIMLKKILTRNFIVGNKYGIKPIDINTLLLVAKYPNNTLGYYSYKLNMEMGSFNYIIKKLVKLDLVEIIISKNDKRCKKLSITDKGMEEVLYLRKIFNDQIKIKLDMLDDEERALFISSMRIVRNIAYKLVEKE